MAALAKPFSPGELERWFTSKRAERVQRGGSSAPSVSSAGSSGARRGWSGQSVGAHAVPTLAPAKSGLLPATPSRDHLGASPTVGRHARQGMKGRRRRTESFDSSASGSSATSSMGLGSMPEGEGAGGGGHSRPVVVHSASKKPKVRRGSPATRSWDLNTDDLVCFWSKHVVRRMYAVHCVTTETQLWTASSNADTRANNCDRRCWHSRRRHIQRVARGCQSCTSFTDAWER